MRKKLNIKWSDQTEFNEHGKNVSGSALKDALSVHISYAPSSGTPMRGRVKFRPTRSKNHCPGPASLTIKADTSPPQSAAATRCYCAFPLTV